MDESLGKSSKWMKAGLCAMTGTRDYFPRLYMGSIPRTITPTYYCAFFLRNTLVTPDGHSEIILF